MFFVELLTQNKKPTQ